MLPSSNKAYSTNTATFVLHALMKTTRSARQHTRALNLDIFAARPAQKQFEPSLFASSLPQRHTKHHTGLLQRGFSLQDVATNAAAGSLGMQVRANTADLLKTCHRAKKSLKHATPLASGHVPPAFFWSPEARDTPIHTRRWRKLRPVFAAWIHSSAKTWGAGFRLVGDHMSRTVSCAARLVPVPRPLRHTPPHAGMAPAAAYVCGLGPLICQGLSTVFSQMGCPGMNLQSLHSCLCRAPLLYKTYMHYCNTYMHFSLPQ